MVFLPTIAVFCYIKYKIDGTIDTIATIKDAIAYMIFIGIVNPFIYALSG